MPSIDWFPSVSKVAPTGFSLGFLLVRYCLIVAAGLVVLGFILAQFA
jgi:hypothetical protein